MNLRPEPSSVPLGGVAPPRGGGVPREDGGRRQRHNRAERSRQRLGRRIRTTANGPAPEDRTRTVRWHDPRAILEAAPSKTGLELLESIAAGRLPPPPIAELLGMRLVVIEPSRAVFEIEPAEFLYSPLQTVHGGIITVLLDSAMGCAFHSTLPAGLSYTTLEIKVNFLRPVTEGVGPIRAEGRVLHAGNTIGTADGRLTDREGTLFAHATTTLMVLRPRAAPPVPRR